MRNIALFGCSLDPDERDANIQRKVRYVQSKQEKPRNNRFSDPYDVILGLTKLIDKKGLIVPANKIDVETWLTPFPFYHDLILLNTFNFVSFIDMGGCWEYCIKVADFVKKILPSIPFLAGVDHSLSGGCAKALSETYGERNILNIIVDTHFDAISTPVKCSLIQYDIEKNLRTKFDVNDPYIYDRSDSYNTASFLKFLVKEEIILPENTICIGVSDYPPLEAIRSRDERIIRYVEEFESLERKGLRIVRKDELRQTPNTLQVLLENYGLPYVSVSIDMDVGAKAACSGVRFLDYEGMQRNEILKIMRDIRVHALKRGTLVGLDMMEFDMHSADENTFTLALMMIKHLLGLQK